MLFLLPKCAVASPRSNFIVLNTFFGSLSVSTLSFCASAGVPSSWAFVARSKSRSLSLKFISKVI